MIRLSSPCRVLQRKLRCQNVSPAAAFSSYSNRTSNGDLWDKNRVNAFVGHNFPDFLEHWNRKTFRKVGYGLNAATAVSVAAGAGLMGSTGLYISFLPAAAMGALTYGYWKVGLQDIKQTSHALRRNYPVLANIRYILETIRPELRQYIVESDTDGRPFNRLTRAQVYQRAKNVDDTIPFGTRRDVYQTHHEWACHSMWPREIESENAKRHVIGTSQYGTTKPYSASVLNISAMSYGAISDNAILALNRGAKLGGFYHNTGEGGVSRFHLEGGGDIVWNVGTGYFGCGSGEGKKRVFEPSMLKETIDEAQGRIKMIEIKLSQGAKPGHGGLLPRAKITREIAEARKLPFPANSDCHSPARHSAFSTPFELIEYLASVREISGGLPVGIKMCVGQPGEFASLCKAMLALQNGPDFITVDGAEGGTGAAPPELTNSVGLPLEEGLVVVRNMLEGAGLRDKTAINASGRVASAFSLVRTVAIGADITCAARAFMLSLGCIQALKCNTNKCPTGIATQDKDLMFGLDPDVKAHRVYHFHRKTMNAASDIIGIMGYDSFYDVQADDIMRRVQHNKVRTLAEHFPGVDSGCLLHGKGPPRLQAAWDSCEPDSTQVCSRRWIVE
jgi:glutamate synthase domain-containing protein 2